MRRDGYSSLQIDRQQPGGSYVEIFSEREGPFWQLWTRGSTIERWREELSKPLPGDCQLQ